MEKSESLILSGVKATSMLMEVTLLSGMPTLMGMANLKYAQYSRMSVCITLVAYPSKMDFS